MKSLDRLSTELATLQASVSPKDRGIAAFIRAAFRDIDKDNHDKGLYDFKAELLAWLSSLAVGLWALADKAEGLDLGATMLRRPVRGIASVLRQAAYEILKASVWLSAWLPPNDYAVRA